MGSEEPSALFFVAEGAAKGRVQCRDGQREKSSEKYGVETMNHRNTRQNRHKIMLQKQISVQKAP